ncbi:MAG: ASCH domain-containing protein [Actinomycetota bacterium]
MATSRDAAVEAFWREFADATGVTASYGAWAFGGDDMPELATELGVLVRDGPKRATTGRLDGFEPHGEPLPEVGDHSVILDGAGQPLCIIRTTRVDTASFGEVDEEFAWVEGEGDRSLASWREAHIRFFAGEDTPITDDDLVVLERFEVVWPVPDGSFAMAAAAVPLGPGELDPAQVLVGSPEVTEAVVSETDDGRIVRGVWRITEGTVTDVEQDELFVVLEGRATIEIDGGPTLLVGPGDLCVLERGARTTWTVHEPLRKVFQITMPGDEDA